MPKVYKISIIIPVYNVRKYVGRCINSVFAQECRNAEIECILVDDCTEDDSMEIIAQELKGYTGKIHFITESRPVNGGLCATRNTGVRVAQGDYILFVDSDDYLQPGTVQYFIEELEKAGGNVDVVMGNSFLSKYNKHAMTFDTDKPVLYDNSDESALKGLLNRVILHTAWNKLVRLDFLLKYSVYFEKGIIDEDLLWSYLIFLNAKRVLVVPRVTYIYEDNPTSIMNTTYSKLAKVIRSRIIICNQILDSPPKYSFVEYFAYLFYILSRAINLYEQNKKDSLIGEFCDDINKLRNRFLSEVRDKRLYILYIFFLTSRKPFYYIVNCRWYRRYFDKLEKCMVTISNLFLWKR